MLTLLRMNPHKLKNGLMQLEMGLHDGSVNAFFRKEDFFKKIQKCYECLKKYSEELNNTSNKIVQSNGTKKNVLVNTKFGSEIMVHISKTRIISMIIFLSIDSRN